MVDVATHLRESLVSLQESGPAPGRAWCEAWTDEVDAGLTTLFEALEPAGRLSLVATGGYGRRELCPGSDIDLLLLYDGVAHNPLETTVREVVYPLWDAGLKVGHAVRDHRQTISSGLDDVETATSLLDGRVVCGPKDLFRSSRSELIRRIRKRPDRFLAGLSDANIDRRVRVGGAAESLEPDIKRGPGSLRDVQSLSWAAAAMLGEVGLDPLVPAGYLGASDRPRIARAYDQLLTVRVALHLEVGRPSDVLRFEIQQAVAERLGYEDGESDSDTAAHRLVHDVYLAARTSDHIHRRAWRFLSADAKKGRRRRRPAEAEIDGFGIADGVLSVPDSVDLNDPALPTRLLAALAASNSVLERSSAARLTRSVQARIQAPAAGADEASTAEQSWDDESRRRFLEVLWRGEGALRALAELDDVGMLVAALPGWEPLRARPQRNPYHLYSLDRHAAHAAIELGSLVRREPWAASALARVDDRDGLMLGVLLHDVGKAYGEPHSETGVPVAQAMARAMGAAEESIALVGTLVRQHLLLPDAATRRDLADPGVAIGVADEVGDPQTLACLHLLTAADGIATGPQAWNDWKATLVHTLARKVQAVFDEAGSDEVGETASAHGAEAQDLATSLGVDPEVVRAHLALSSARYASSVTARAIVRHARAAGGALGPGEVRTRVTPGDSDEADVSGYDQLDVIVLDRPGTFAKVAGVIALHGGSVLSANAFSRTDGVAVDTFTVEPPSPREAGWWPTVEGDIVEAVAGRLALRARVAQKAKSRPRQGPKLDPILTTVEVVEDQSGTMTVLEIHTTDRIGVLFTIAEALAELELDIVLAKISTVGHEAVDVFYVRDAAGKPLHREHTRETVLAVQAALAALP